MKLIRYSMRSLIYLGPSGGSARACTSFGHLIMNGSDDLGYHDLAMAALLKPMCSLSCFLKKTLLSVQRSTLVFAFRQDMRGQVKALGDPALPVTHRACSYTYLYMFHRMKKVIGIELGFNSAGTMCKQRGDIDVC
jgi:hypothetical protein